MWGIVKSATAASDVVTSKTKPMHVQSVWQEAEQRRVTSQKIPLPHAAPAHQVGGDGDEEDDDENNHNHQAN